MRLKSRVTRVPGEGTEYKGNILHVFLGQNGTLVVSVYVEDKDLPNGYIADFVERTPARVSEFIERLLRTCQGRANFDASLLGQPVTVFRQRGRLQLRKPVEGQGWKELEGMEFSDDPTDEIIDYYPML